MVFCALTFAVSNGSVKTLPFVLVFQHLPQNLGNVNALKTMFDPYIGNLT